MQLLVLAPRTPALTGTQHPQLLHKAACHETATTEVMDNDSISSSSDEGSYSRCIISTILKAIGSLGVYLYSSQRRAERKLEREANYAENYSPGGGRFSFAVSCLCSLHAAKEMHYRHWSATKILPQ